MKSKLIYRLLTISTLILPMALYLILSATIFSVTPDATIDAHIDDTGILRVDEGYILYPTQNASMDGYIVYDETVGYGLLIDEDDVVEVGGDMYAFGEQDGVSGFYEVSYRDLRREESYRMPVAFMISVMGALIAVLIIQGKMNWHKDHPRAAAFLALLTGTVILYVINLIVANMLGVFMVATASWGAYCLEYLVHTNAISQEEADKADNDITSALKKALGI